MRDLKSIRAAMDKALSNGDVEGAKLILVDFEVLIEEYDAEHRANVKLKPSL